MAVSMAVLVMFMVVSMSTMMGVSWNDFRSLIFHQFIQFSPMMSIFVVGSIWIGIFQYALGLISLFLFYTI